MPEFTVPQLEHEFKIIGPLTFRQFIYVGSAGAICFFLYFTIPFFFFLLASMPIMLAGAALAFGQMGGRKLPDILKNFLFFLFAPKIYLWKKKTGPPPKLAIPTPSQPAIIEKTTVPTMAAKSKLKELSSQIETKGQE